MRLGAAIKIAKEILDREGGEDRGFHPPNLSETSTVQSSPAFGSLPAPSTKRLNRTGLSGRNRTRSK